MPSIYVGTYAKYNRGSLEGGWVDLDEYPTADEFYEHIKALHADEYDPEFMFQDREGIPERMVAESSIGSTLWDWLELAADEQEVVAAYLSENSNNESVASILENFAGKYDSERDWAEDYIAETGVLSEVPDSLQHYIDYEAYARDARLGGDVGFIQYNGEVYVFYNH